MTLFSIDAAEFVRRLKESPEGQAIAAAYSAEMLELRAQKLSERAAEMSRWAKREAEFEKETEAARAAVVAARRKLREALDQDGKVKGSRGRELREHTQTVDQQTAAIRALCPAELRAYRDEIAREQTRLNQIARRTYQEAAELAAYRDEARETLALDFEPADKLPQLIEESRVRLRRRVTQTAARLAIRQALPQLLPTGQVNRIERHPKYKARVAAMAAAAALERLDVHSRDFEASYDEIVAPIRKDVALP
ncbi:MAG: hypothetical protein AB7N24_17300 [Dehalococcoidia bacterium]